MLKNAEDLKRQNIFKQRENKKWGLGDDKNEVSLLPET